LLAYVTAPEQMDGRVLSFSEFQVGGSFLRSFADSDLNDVGGGKQSFVGG
jgi:hypothetical protein